MFIHRRWHRAVRLYQCTDVSAPVANSSRVFLNACSTPISMFVLGNSLFVCGVRSAHERSYEEALGETEVGRRPLPPPCPLMPRTHSAGMQTEPQLEPATSMGVILPETGQFLLLCSLQLWQQLQRCRQTRARVPLFFIHFTSVLQKQFAATDMFLREPNSYKRALALRNSRQQIFSSPQTFNKDVLRVHGSNKKNFRFCLWASTSVYRVHWA